LKVRAVNVVVVMKEKTIFPIFSMPAIYQAAADAVIFSHRSPAMPDGRPHYKIS